MHWRRGQGHAGNGAECGHRAVAAGSATFLIKVKTYREEPINEQADDVADDGRQADNDMSTQHGLEGWFSRKRASSEVGSLCGQMGYAHGWKPS